MTVPLRGTYTVMITPFNEAGGLDLAATRNFVDWQISEGIHGLVPLGSTGEFLSLTDDEKSAVTETVIKSARGQVPVVVGTGAENTDDVIRYSREAEMMGASGVMIIPPFYSTPTDDELFEHFRRVSDAISIPIMVYNNPATANVDLTPQIVERLSHIDNCCYIKELTMDVTRVRDIIDLCGDRMTVFGGIMGFESFLAGAQGWVAVASNLVPKESARLFELWADERNFEGAREINERILPIIRMVGGPRFVSASKAGLALMGRDVGKPRPPRLPLPHDQMAKLRDALHSANVSIRETALT